MLLHAAAGRARSLGPLGCTASHTAQWSRQPASRFPVKVYCRSLRIVSCLHTRNPPSGEGEVPLFCTFWTGAAGLSSMVRPPMSSLAACIDTSVVLQTCTQPMMGSRSRILGAAVSPPEFAALIESWTSHPTPATTSPCEMYNYLVPQGLAERTATSPPPMPQEITYRHRRWAS